MDMRDFAKRESGLKLTLLEVAPVRAAEIGGKVYERVGLAKTARARGKALARELKPVLRREADLKINIAHAYGVARCNAYINEAHGRIAVLEDLQREIALELGLTISPDAAQPVGESESIEHGNRTATVGARF